MADYYCILCGRLLSQQDHYCERRAEKLMATDEEQGLYQKYMVVRRGDHQGKHDDCFMFVLDLDHDPHAKPALEAYLQSCEAEFPLLAADLQQALDNKYPRMSEQLKAEMQHRWNRAWVKKDPGYLPTMQVTQEEYEVIREHGDPWTELSDGREMWGGVVVEVQV